jgi:hypothetical protein
LNEVVAERDALAARIEELERVMELTMQHLAICHLADGPLDAALAACREGK